MPRNLRLILAAPLAVCLAACSGQPLATATPAAGAFATPTGPTVFDSHPPNVCPPPPDPPPEGCTPPEPGPGPGPGPAPEIPASPYTTRCWRTRRGEQLARVTHADPLSRRGPCGVHFTGVVADTTNIHRSAISSDGLTFSMESGARLPQGMGHTRVLRLSDGRIRAYSAVGDGIVSSISSDDGLTFTRESGHRLTSGQIGFTPSGPSNIVRTPDGLYRMYFSDLPRPGEGVLPHRVVSAASVDLLTWTMDPGVRLGEGSALTGNAEHPAAIANPDGSVSLFYFRNTNMKMLMATAADGLTFASEFDTGISQANDPDLVPLRDGSVRMYYNWGNDASGAIYSALYAGTPFGPSAR